MPTVIVTGANRGLGLEFCRQLQAAQWDVIACCRKGSTALSELGVRIEEGIDVGADSVIEEIQKRLGSVKLDAAVLNAGIMKSTSLERFDTDAMRQQFEVNALGPLRIARGVLEHLNEGGKVLLVTSRMGSIADNSSGGSYGYRMSKAALNMAGVSLAHDLRSRAIAVGIVHPGYVRTDMTSHSGHVDPPESVKGMLARLSALSMSNTGTFWHANGEVLPW